MKGLQRTNLEVYSQTFNNLRSSKLRLFQNTATFNIVSMVTLSLTDKMAPEPILSIKDTVNGVFNGQNFEGQREVTCKQVLDG